MRSLDYARMCAAYASRTITLALSRKRKRAREQTELDEFKKQNRHGGRRYADSQSVREKTARRSTIAQFSALSFLP